MKAMFRERRDPAPPTRFQSTLQVVHPVFEVTANLPETSRIAPHGLARTSALALVAVEEALRGAGLLPIEPGGLRIGVCIGTTVGSALNSTEFYAGYLDHTEPEMRLVLRFLTNNPAALVARYYGLSGPCQTVANACSSSTDAIGIGASWIRGGICDMVIAGGADELSRVAYNGFNSLMVADDQPCKPFDLRRKGLNLGEGAAMLILESEEMRERRQSRPQAFITGYASACDAYHLTAPSPEGTGLKSALLKALDMSEKNPEEIAFVNAHGTGTQDNDKVESKVLHELLPGVPFLSTKGFTGHTLGAAGAIEAVFTILGLKEGRIPASPGFSEPDPNLAGTPVSEPRVVHGTVALSESLAFGGQNSVLVLEVAND